MSDKVIVLFVVLAAVAVIAVVFIRRAMRYGKALGAAAPETEKEVMPEADAQPEPPPEMPSAREVYLSRFIHRKRDKFKFEKTISVRPDYHSLISVIVHIIGRDKISLAAYLDNVLKAHIDENRDSIIGLYNEMKAEIIKDEG